MRAPTAAASTRRSDQTSSFLAYHARIQERTRRVVVEHEVHHRGQLYLMLRLLGVETPPLYGLTSEEVRERSLPCGR